MVIDRWRYSISLTPGISGTFWNGKHSLLWEDRTESTEWFTMKEYHHRWYNEDDERERKKWWLYPFSPRRGIGFPHENEKKIMNNLFSSGPGDRYVWVRAWRYDKKLERKCKLFEKILIIYEHQNPSQCEGHGRDQFPEGKWLLSRNSIFSLRPVL